MKYQYYILLMLLSFSVSFLESEKSIRLFSSKQVTKNQLKKEIVERMERVDELREIRKLAGELGIKHVYLFGGSAAAWAHYVYWDLEREAGMGNYHESRFDYDYTSIFRSNQDMDIVVDIDEDNAGLIRKFESQLQEHFPHFQGNKPAWEVRPLRFSYGGKDQILDNPDFLAQNSDSHSTGLISVTDHDEMRIRDFKDWDNEKNHFFEDVYNRELHFYRDQKMHEATERFKRGLNPEIFSVVRYLTKAFQYELAMDQESLHEIKEILKVFNAKEDLKDGYAKSWVEKNAKKLYQNAIDIEYAYHTLKELNLQDILIQILNNENRQDSLAWWMSKMPLLSFPLSDNHEGKVTAKDLNIDIVAHETRSFSAYESITKSHSGLPNVFISRSHGVGEGAAHGDGFYTRKGPEGAVGSGLTIRFKVHPDAEEGKDFIVASHDYVIFRNKNAFKVIPESLNISFLEYFIKLSNRELLFDSSDRGVKEKVRRKVGLKSRTLSDEDRLKVYELVKNHLTHYKDKKFDEFLSEFFSFDIYKDYPDLISLVLSKGIFDNQVAEIIIEEGYEKFVKEIEILLKEGSYDSEVIVALLPHVDHQKHPQLIGEVVAQGSNRFDNFLVEIVLNRPLWGEGHRYIVETILKRRMKDTFIKTMIVDRILTQEGWSNHPELVKYLIENGTNRDRELIIAKLFSLENWVKHNDLIELLYTYPHTHKPVLEKVYSKFDFSHRDDWIRELLAQEKFSGVKTLIDRVLVREEWFKHKDIVYELVDRGSFNNHIITHLLSKGPWINDRELIEKVFNSGCCHNNIIAKVLGSPGGEQYLDLLNYYMADEKYHKELAIHVFSEFHWRDHDFMIKKLIDGGKANSEIAEYILYDRYWSNQPDLLEALIESNRKFKHYNADKLIARRLFTRKHWSKHPSLLKKLINNGMAIDDILNATFSEPRVNYPDLGPYVEELLKDSEKLSLLIPKLMYQDSWKPYTQKVVTKMIEDDVDVNEVINKSLLDPKWDNASDLVEIILSRDNKYTSNLLLKQIASKAGWEKHELFINKLLENEFYRHVLSKHIPLYSHWNNKACLSSLNAIL